MIDISTEAKMLLMENQKTLFKADLILQNRESASGKNLCEHENSKSISCDYENVDRVFFTGTDNVGDIKSIPITLFWNYRYAIVSMDIKFTEMSVTNRFYLGFGFKKPDGTIIYYYVSSLFQDVVVSDEFARYTFVWDKITWRSTMYDQITELVSLNIRFENTCSVKAEFKNAMYELNDTGIPSEYVNSYITNGGSYGALGYFSLNGDDVMANTVSFSDSVSSSGSFDIGAAIINSLSLTLNNYDDRFSLYDFTGAKIRPYIGIPLETTEWITKGYYTVEKPTSQGSTIPLTMLDNMSKFCVPFKDVILTFPSTAGQILQSVCIYCGVVLNGATFPNYDYSIPARPEDDNLTCLDMVSAIAQLAGCFAHINNNGYLELSWYDTTSFDDGTQSYDGGTFLTHTTPYSDGDTLDGGDFNYDGTENVADGGGFTYGNYYSCYAFNSFSVGTDEITITGIKVTVDSDNYYAVGEDGYVLDISDNPLITTDNMQSVANYLGNRIIGFKFRPFNVSAISNPSVEAGDAIRLTDRNGNYYDTYITTCSYKFGNYETFACNAETPSERASTDYSPLTKAVEKARKDTEKILSEYDKAVINMNEIAVNPLGYHTSYTENLDGSRISYIHNKPTREESTIIWQQSASGFFLSTDGGATWVSGWDANGNAVLNILYAIGIVCDWIKGGTLTLGGDNNVNGLMRVLNAAGSQVCKIDQTGIDVIAGTIGGIKINSSGLGSSNLGETLDGMWISPDGGLSFAHFLGSTWSQLNYRSGTNVLGLWTAGANVGGGGMDISGGAPGDYNAGWVRWGWSDGQRSDGYYVSWYSGSDRRLKKNIKTLDNRVLRELFSRINPIEFNYKKASCADTSEKHFGVIAQEIQELLEDLGYGNNHIVEEKAVLRKSESGKDSCENYYYVNYHELHGLEIGAIKDLYEKSDEQQTEIDDLKNTVSKQRAEIDELKEQVKYLMEKVGV